MSKDIIVLAPNGRRQTVKCTLNTTILQILEEVCTKQGYDPRLYDLTHHNKILDLTNTIRFSNLPNRANLEMVEALKRRTENNVTIALQLENGDRHMADFNPTSSLYDVLTKLASSELSRCNHPTVVYTRREVYGDELRRTTLRDLGLTSGRAVLRLIDKSLEELKTQANVSSILQPRSIEINKSDLANPKPIDKHSTTPNDAIVSPLQIHDPQPGPSNTLRHFSVNDPIKVIKDRMRLEANKNAIDETDEPNNKTNDVMEVDNVDNVETDILPVNSEQSHTNSYNYDEQLLQRRLNIEQEVNFLGDNKAIAFTQSGSEPELTELPDEFYELTIDEVRRLYSELRQNASAVTNAPLLTAEQRQSKTERPVSNHIHKYVVVRVQFPDCMVLQGVFSPDDTIQDVHTFTKQYLKEPNRPFLLYTTPSRQALNLKLTLAEARFVPGVLMHFRWADDGVSEAPYLKKRVYSNSTSSEAAAILASKYRTPVRQKREVNTEKNQRAAMAGTSSTKDGKLPKWFKT